MGIARFETVNVNKLIFGVSSYGEQATTITKWFTTRARVSDVKANLRISDAYRVYSDMVNLQFQYTPHMQTVADNQPNYSITYRNQDWRVTDAFESDDRMKITLVCYRNDPSVRV